jgi:hypothetical protein
MEALAYSSALKLEATCSSETSVDIQRTICRYILEERTLLKKEFVHFPPNSVFKRFYFIGFSYLKRLPQRYI